MKNKNPQKYIARLGNRLLNRGMMTVELLMAFFLWGIFLTGIFSLWFGLFGPKTPFFEYIEQEKFFVTTALSTDGGLSAIFTRSYMDRGLIRMQSPQGLFAVLADWHNGMGKKVCRGLDSANLEQVDLAEPFLLDGMNVATSMMVRGQYIYMTTNSGSTTDSDFYIISIEDPLAPIVVSKIDTGPGLTALSVAGYSAYVANTSINSQAQAIDISSPISPVLKWSFKVPGSAGTSTALGKAIVSDGERVFLGVAKNESSELFSMDAETGQLLAEYEMSAGVNGVYINNSLFLTPDSQLKNMPLLYVASPVDPELLVFDVSVRSAFRPTAHFDAPGGSGNGKSIEIINDDIYLGRTVGGNELLRLRFQSGISGESASTSIPTYPTSTLPLLKNIDSKKIGSTIDSMLASKNFLYILTGHSQKELQIWKRADSSEELSLSSTSDLSARGVGIGCSGNYLFVALGTHEPLLVFQAK